jgi:hypothetical protein
MIHPMHTKQAIAAGALAAAIVSSIAPFALAQGAPIPARIGGDKSWDAYSYSEKAGKVCYILGHPAKSEPANANRGRIEALVTHRPAEKAFFVVNFDVGYPFKPDSSAELEIDAKKFILFTDKDSAWARDPATDKAVAEALAKGKQATLKGSSARGTSTTDTYTLEGFAQALAAIDKDCGVKH